MSNNIVLCGIKHSGKSTQGKMLAMMRSLDFYDTDEYLERLHRERTDRDDSVREIYKRYGAEYFQELEAQAIELITDEPEDKVISLGGGVVDNPLVDKEMLEDLGVLIFLDVAPDVAYNRIVEVGLPPFLDNNAPYEDFLRLYDLRREKYQELADYTLSIPEELPPDEVAEMLRKITDRI